MKRFYTTKSPDAARHILKQTLEEALEDAKKKVALEGETRYVVQILYRVEVAPAPVKVSSVSEDE